MIQAIGLTSDPRKELPPAVDDVSFEARAGRVTALLGASGAGKTTALRLMLELQRGRGVTYFRGRPLHRIAHPSREVGVLLGDLPGHPSRTVRGHLRMLCAAAGVPARRADEVLEVVGLVSLREERLGTLSRGMDRRLGLACALLADPHTLVLDDPAGGLSTRESRWLYGMLHAHATQGGTVLLTTADPKQAARTADRVVTLQRGRLIADQEAADFARTRLRPRVAVRTPHASRLAALLAKEARTAHRSVEVVRESGNRLSVYGSTCADVGEIAFRHGILVHQLADEIGDMGPGTEAGPHAAEPRAYEVPQKPDAALAATGGRRRKPTSSPVPDSGLTGPDDPAVEREVSQGSRREQTAAAAAQEACVEVPQASAEVPQARAGGPRPADASTGGSRAPGAGSRSSSSSVVALPDLPPPISVRPAPSPLRPLRYELRRAVGVGTSFATGAAVLVVSALTAVLLARVGPVSYTHVPGCSVRSRSVTSSATPPWPRTAAPSPAGWGCWPRNSSSPPPPRWSWPSSPWAATPKCSTSSTGGSSRKFPPSGFR